MTRIISAKVTHPALFQRRWYLLNFSRSDQFLAFQAYSLPLNPRIIATNMFTIGIQAKRLSQTRLGIPHIHVRKNAPQDHPFTPIGSSLASFFACSSIYKILVCACYRRVKHQTEGIILSHPVPSMRILYACIYILFDGKPS